MTVKNIMSQDLVMLKPTDKVCDALMIMHEEHIRNLPVVDEDDQFVRLFGIRPLLGSFLSCVDDAQAKIEEIMASEVDGYVLRPHATIAPDEPAIKALAMMEEYTSYLFVVDAGEYQGIITIQGIADVMSKMYARSEHPE